MILLVPDEDLYEQGYWPSIFNNDHKFTFTLNKSESWSPVSLNMADLVITLENGEVIKLGVQDDNYDYSLKREPIDRVSVIKRRKLIKRLAKVVGFFGLSISDRLSNAWKVPVDQTAKGALAQIQLIMKKNT